MYLSKYFLPILKENPSEAQIASHRLMLRSGMIKQSSAGIYSWLPLGLKVLKKIENIDKYYDRVDEILEVYKMKKVIFIQKKLSSYLMNKKISSYLIDLLKVNVHLAEQRINMVMPVKFVEKPMMLLILKILTLLFLIQNL